MLGTSRPSRNSALPIPVPKVSSRTTPRTLRPAPNAISATPAASASLSTVTGRPSSAVNLAAASSPSQSGCRFAALPMTPWRTTPGKVTPTGSLPFQLPATSTSAGSTASGVAGRGVSTRTRSSIRAPASTSTGAPLIPDPPMSMPRTVIVPSPARGCAPAYPPADHATCGRRTRRRAAIGHPAPVQLLDGEPGFGPWEVRSIDDVLRDLGVPGAGRAPRAGCLLPGGGLGAGRPRRRCGLGLRLSRPRGRGQAAAVAGAACSTPWCGCAGPGSELAVTTEDARDRGRAGACRHRRQG